MRCPYCSKNNDRVVDSREGRDGETIRRRRECLECRRRFTSYEQIEDIPYMVVKSDGRRELWSRSKLMSGLHKACEKRPIPTSVLEELVETIETNLHQREEREMTTQEVGALVMEKLRSTDPVAYVRFASVYRSFEDVGAFVDEVRNLLDETGSSIPAEPQESPDAGS